MPALSSITFDLASRASGLAEPNRDKVVAQIRRLDDLVSTTRRLARARTAAEPASSPARVAGLGRERTLVPAVASRRVPSVDRAAPDLGMHVAHDPRPAQEPEE